MALWELDDFQGPRFLGFVRGILDPNTFQGTKWLPDQPVFDLEFEYIKGTLNRPVMASVMGWDSEAPIAGRRALGERVQGELPPIKRKVKIGEKEIIRFLTPRAGTPDKQNAINSVYDLTADLVQSVKARVEWLRMQALSEDQIVYDEGGVLFNFDYGLTEKYQLNLQTQQDGGGNSIASDVSTVWSDVAASQPVLDLQYICDLIETEQGYRPAEFVCSRKALGYLLRNDNVRAMIRGSNAPNAILTRAELDTVFSLYSLPTITTYDVKVQKENADGSQTEARPLAENKSFLVPPGSVGNTLWGPTAESRPLLGTALASEAPGLLAVTYGKEEPPSEWIKAVAVAFPSLPDGHLLGQMKLFA